MLPFIPDDRGFNKFKQEARAKYPNNSALSKLEKSSNNRAFFSWKNKTEFNKYLSSDLNLNYVSDDYYFRDFSDAPSDINNNQLLDRADLDFHNDHWRFLTRLQAFQTLHMVTDINDAVDQYARLPELDLIGNYPNQKFDLDYNLNSQFVNFEHVNDFISGKPVVDGGRLHVAPSVSMPLKWAGAYLTPQLIYDMSFYNLQHQAEGRDAAIERYLPLFNVDGGLLFERALHFFGHDYTQTLEPRIFYLFVPRHNQDDIPLFDSYLSPFDFGSLFRINRFSGYDRVGDANQLTVALTSRFMDATSGEQKLRFSIGEIIAAEKHKEAIDGGNKL